MRIAYPRKDTYESIRRTTEFLPIESELNDKIYVYEIDTFHSLTQFVGFAKYYNREHGNVFYRGQNKLYPQGLVPSLYRSVGIKTANVRTRAFYAIKTASNKCKCLHGIDKDVKTCLLQHYGIRTNCLDVVDNLWVAIWFALYSFNAIVVDGREHIHIQQMDESTYAYIFLIGTDAIIENMWRPGVFEGKKTKLFDLRKASPSLFLRPHAQHALMLKNRIDGFYNYNDWIVGIVRFKVSNGLEWIGKNGLLSIQSLFPPTHYDGGYRYLLNEYKSNVDAIKAYGSIQMISY